jgi:TonB family protein
MRDGSVARAKVIKSVPALDKAVLESFQKWRFKPATTGGEPVPVWIAVPFRFE